MPDLTPSYGLPYPNDTDSLKAAVKDIPKALALAIEGIVAALTGAPGPAWVAYTPTIGSETGALGAGNTATGEYLVIGRLVYWRATVNIAAVGSASNALRVGIPAAFPMAASWHYGGGGRESNVTGKFIGTYPATATAFNANFVDGTAILASGRRYELAGFYKR